MKKIPLLAVFIIFMFTGCMDKSPAVINFIPSKSITFNANKLEVADKAISLGWEYGGFGDSKHRYKWITEQLKKEAFDTIKKTFLLSGGDYKIYVSITEADIYNTWQGIKNTPIVGILAAGIEEDIICTLSVTIEIENKNGQVISSQSIKIQKTDKLRYGETPQIAYGRVIDMTLQELQTEIIKQSNRTLYNYLAK